MINIQKSLSSKKNVSTTITERRTKIKNGVQKFQDNFSEAKSQSKSKSKRKNFFLGFTIVLSIFGIKLIVQLLPAITKDV